VRILRIVDATDTPRNAATDKFIGNADILQKPDESPLVAP
jgi:hypothetical protein